MDNRVREFVCRLRQEIPRYFCNANLSVLDAGSLDINGSNREFFSHPERVLGVDGMAGPGVDHVGLIHEFDHEPFDVVMSTGSLEHDEHWRETVRHLVRLTKPGGFLFIHCAGTGHREHCTKNNPKRMRDGTLIALDYYCNVSIEELSSAIPEQEFQRHRFWQHNTYVYFAGIKK